jgi:ribosomal protein S12 methylthiotransferase accessory factor
LLKSTEFGSVHIQTGIARICSPTARAQPDWRAWQRLGRVFERLSTNYFWTHYYLGPGCQRSHVRHSGGLRLTRTSAGHGLERRELRKFYNRTILTPVTVEFNSGSLERGICAVPMMRERDGVTVYFPVNIIGNLYVCNGMSAGNTQQRKRTQALSRGNFLNVTSELSAEGICLDVPETVITRFPRVRRVSKHCEASFGIWSRRVTGRAIPGDEYHVAAEDQGVCQRRRIPSSCAGRALTELLQGRALDSLSGSPPGLTWRRPPVPPILRFISSTPVV